MLISQVTPIQPVNGVVQIPAGAPIWLTIVLSGCIGAISAILGGLAVEYLKPIELLRPGGGDPLDLIQSPVNVSSEVSGIMGLSRQKAIPSPGSARKAIHP
jgi:hypothetical protein